MHIFSYTGYFIAPLITLLTLGAAWALVFVTWRLIRTQMEYGKKDLQVRLERDLVKRFEVELLEERKKLARQLINKASHEEIQEPVMNFFEDVWFYLKRKYLDKEFVWHDFAHYSIRWWYALRKYITEERKRQENDNTIFASFEYLAQVMKKFDDKKGKKRKKQENKERTPPQKKSADEINTDFLTEEENL